MISLLPKTKNSFAYIQVEATEIIFQLFRFEERVYDAVLLKSKSVAGDFRQMASAAPVLASYIDEARRIPGCRVIVGMHSGLLTTTETVVTIRREDPRRPVDDAELENIVSSGLWKIFSRDQKTLAHKMNCAEASVVLVGAFITQVRVDAHRVASPVGFPAHTVELTVLYSASSKAAHDVLAPLLAGEQEVYCTEIGVSETLRLAEQKSAGNFVLMRVSEAYTYVYAAHQDEISYIDTIHWGRRSLVHSLVHELMINEEQAINLLRLADAGLTSLHVRRRIETLLLQEVSVLLKGIGSHVGRKEVEAVYVAAPFSLPPAIFGDTAARRAGIEVPVIPMPNNSHGEKGESALPLSMKPTASSVSALCANAWAALRSFEQSEVQKIAKRRARWLAGSLSQ